MRRASSRRCSSERVLNHSIVIRGIDIILEGAAWPHPGLRTSAGGRRYTGSSATPDAPHEAARELRRVPLMRACQPADLAKLLRAQTPDALGQFGRHNC